MSLTKYEFLNLDIKENYENHKDNLYGLARFIISKHSLKGKERNIYEYIRKFVKRNKNVLNSLEGSKTWEENSIKGTAEITFLTGNPIKTLEDAIESSKIDLSEWEVERWISNSWGVTSWKNENSEYSTNYQVKLWLRKRKPSNDELFEEFTRKVSSLCKERNIIRNNFSKGIGVVSMTDFHLGADIKDLVRTPDFNMEILLNYLDSAVDRINSLNYKEVHLNLLGDFFESISGLNHPDSFKGLKKELVGANAIIMASEVISGKLISKIENLSSVNIVSGNHDRLSHSNKIENTGEGGKLLYYMLSKEFKDLPMEYSNYVISKEIDGIRYLLTHGDKNFSRKDSVKFVLDYGDNSKYNVVLEGHKHTRLGRSSLSKQLKKYEDIEVVSIDDLNYRKINVPSLFTGNYFSETLGFSGTSGFVVTENNGSGKVNFFDFSL